MGDRERLDRARELVKRRREGHFGDKSEIELVELVADLAETIAFQGIEIKALVQDVEEIKKRFGPLGEED